MGGALKMIGLGKKVYKPGDPRIVLKKMEEECQR